VNFWFDYDAWLYRREREAEHRASLLNLEFDAKAALLRINRYADEAAESVRRSHGQHFRHLKQWIKQGDQA